MKKISVLLLILCLILCFASCGDKIVLESNTDLGLVRVGAVASTYGEKYAKECGSENVTVFENIEAASAALAADEIDCIITDFNTAKAAASASDDITTTETRIIEDIDYYAAVRSDDFDTLAVTEVVTSELDKETDFSKLCRGFIENIGHDRDAFITEDRFGTSGVFKLGVIGNIPPYSYVTDSGKIAGISVEYAKRFAQKRDQTLEVKVYDNYSELSNALKSGEIDLFFRDAPLPAFPGISYTTVCYTVELRVLIAEK